MLFLWVLVEQRELLVWVEMVEYHYSVPLQQMVVAEVVLVALAMA
jgi:hypothetical protein